MPNDENSITTSAGSRTMRTAWLVVALLLPVALLNYLDRQMIAAMKSSVMSDITDITTDGNWGYMLGQFKWVYAFLSPVGGYIADRFSRRYTICGSLFVWSAVTWATGFATSYNELLWTRTLMGMSEAFYIPAALALITDYHTGHTRSRAVGMHQIAIYCGVILGGFSGYVADAPSLGWRAAFDFTGIAGILYAIPLLIFLRDAPKPTSIDAQPLAKPKVGRSALELVTNVSFILLVLYFTLPAAGGWIIRDWMPSILKDQFNIGQGKAGVSATLFVSLASIGGALLGGWAADRLMRRTQRGRIIISVIGMCLISPALYFMGFSATLTAAIFWLTLFGLGWGFFDCNNMPILTQIVRPQLRATGYGIMNLISISGGGLADWALGIAKDQKVANHTIFAVLALISLSSIILVLLIKPREDSDLASRS